MDTKHPIAIIVHGGAGNIPSERYDLVQEGCKEAAAAGWEILATGGTALDAVEAAVRVMEDNPAFNAGRGSVLNAAGKVEMDAGLMDGASGKAGAVTLIRHIQHPISLARAVMEQTQHLILGGEGAEQFAQEMGFEFVPNDFFITSYRLEQYRERLAASSADTVGAVALDMAGHVAAANSTGGVSFKRPGRIGDSPIPGAGFYADDRFGAVATTGQGEHIIRAGLSFLVMQLLAEGQLAEDAAADVTPLFLNRVPEGKAGWIVIDTKGNVGIGRTSRNIAYALRTLKIAGFISGIK